MQLIIFFYIFNHERRLHQLFEILTHQKRSKTRQLLIIFKSKSSKLRLSSWTVVLKFKVIFERWNIKKILSANAPSLNQILRPICHHENQGSYRWSWRNRLSFSHVYCSCWYWINWSLWLWCCVDYQFASANWA